MKLEPVLFSPAAEIEWPKILRRGSLSEYRHRIEQLAIRLKSEAAQTAELKQMGFVTQSVLAHLGGHIRDFRSDDYMQAKRFLLTLLTELDASV